MVTDNQVRRLMKLIQTEDSFAVAADKAGMSEPTARKYVRLGRLPSQALRTRSYRTRPDIFEDVWPEVELFLINDPDLEAVTLFDYLSRKFEGRFSASQLRTLQRRIKIWRGVHGPKQEVFFPQLHSPGRLSQSDFTHMGDLGVCISGLLFDHLFYHFTLTYSNWESGSVCFSESFEALSAGLQNALWELGAVPQLHQTDSLSAAVNHIGNPEEFTARYKALMDHYRLGASHTNPGCPNENGDVEQSHHRFKRAVAQELILRGSKNFSSRFDYDSFLGNLLSRRNSSRRDRLMEEMAVMRALPQLRLEDYTAEQIRVSRNSTISIRSNIYSVPSQLISEKVEARVYAERIEVCYAGKIVQQMARLRGDHKHSINYRHVIHSLVRKPGAFAEYRYKQCLFPGLLFRVAYDLLCERCPVSADKQYLKILLLASDVSEERVLAAIRSLVEKGEWVSFEKVERIVTAPQHKELTAPTQIEIAQLDLSLYDRLLESDKEEEERIWR